MNCPTSRQLAIGGPLLRRLLSVHANHKRIAGSALLIGILTIVAKLFVAGREVAIAWRFGVSGTVDAYQLAVTIVTWTPMFLAGAMAVVLVPRLVKIGQSESGKNHFLDELNGTVLIIGLVVAFGTFLLAPLAARLLTSDAAPATLQLTTAMARRMAPVAFAMTISGYFTARLQARERFGYTVTDAIPAVTIAAFIVGPFALAGAMPLILGTDIGFVAQLVVLVFLVLRGDAPLGRFSVRHSSPEWRTLYGATLMMVLGQLLITVGNPIDQAFAARIAEGAVATLGYATRILVLLTGLATVVIGRALLPVLSGAVAEGAFRMGQRQTLQWAGLMFAAAAAATLALWLASPALVHLLFERGAFGPKATASVSAAVRYGAFQLPFYFPAIVLVQWYAATGRFRDILLVTAAALVVKIIANLLLAPLLGVRGIMLSTALMYALTCSLMILMLRRAHALEG